MDYQLLDYGFLLFPGVVSVALLQLLNSKRKSYTSIEIVFYSFILGVLIRIVSTVFLFHQKPDNFFNINNILKSGKFDIFEFILSIGIGIFIALLLSYIRNLGSLNEYLQNYDVTYNHGFENLLDWIINSPSDFPNEMKKRTVVVKNYSNGDLYFYGDLIGQEIHENFIEILLYNEKNNKYQYIQLKPGEFYIEFIEESCESNNKGNELSEDDEASSEEGSTVVDQKKIIPTLFYTLLLFICFINIKELIKFYKSISLCNILIFIISWLFVIIMQKLKLIEKLKLIRKLLKNINK